MTRDDIAAVIEQIPGLNDFGIGLYEHGRNLSPQMRAEKIEADKAILLDSEAACTKVCEWLSDMDSVKVPDESSYNLKHVAEEQIGYVTNGAFIAAAIHCGFPYKLVNESANVLFGISKKSIRIKRDLCGLN